MNLLMPYAFRVLSYNILADSYSNPKWFSQVAPEVMRWERRKLALIKKLKDLNADIICLQEVEEEAFARFQLDLNRQGYLGVYAKKDHAKPDGCATFFKQDKLQFKGSKTIYYQDGVQQTPTSGHLAIVSSFHSELGLLRVANTHLKWDREGTSKVAHIGYRQVKELLDHHVKPDGTVCDWIICGDFNAQTDSLIVEELLLNGFEDAYRGNEQNTCNPNRQAKRIDYIFYTANLRAIPEKITEIDDLTPLPSEDEPSDHLAIVARFVWR